MEYLTPDDMKIAEMNGISESLAKQRFYVKGWDKERAITQKPNLTRKGFIETYRPLIQAAGISESQFYYRMKHWGWTAERAATTPPMNNNGRMPEKTKIKPEMIAKAKSNGINERTFKHRVYNYKWSIERAMTEPIHESHRKKAN